MISRRTFATLLGGTALAPVVPQLARAGVKPPPPFDDPSKVTIALVRYLDTGDFFEAYLSGVTRQAAALGVKLRVFDSHQRAALQANMVDQAIALGVQGIVLQHGLTAAIEDAAKRAVAKGIKVAAFDVNVHNPAIPQIDQDDRELARLVLEQAIKDNGNHFVAGYVYVPGIAPLDRRNETWQKVKAANPGIKQVAQFGTMDNPIANSVANQARAVLEAHPDITVMFAPYDEFAKGVLIAVNEMGLAKKVSIYSADISTADIQLMREPGSPWKATAATNPAVVGEVSVRTVAMLLAGEDPGHHVLIPPKLVTQKMLDDLKVTNMQDLEAKVPSFAKANVALEPWMKVPPPLV